MAVLEYLLHPTCSQDFSADFISFLCLPLRVVWTPWEALALDKLLQKPANRFASSYCSRKTCLAFVEMGCGGLSIAMGCSAGSSVPRSFVLRLAAAVYYDKRPFGIAVIAALSSSGHLCQVLALENAITNTGLAEEAHLISAS